MKKFSVIPFTLILLWAIANADDGVTMLKIDHGARSSGMGSTSFSQDNDPNTVLYNPALGFGFESFTASFGHTEFWDNIRLESGYFAANVNKRLAIHGGIRYAGVTDLEGRTFPTSSPDIIFDAQDISFKGGFAYQVTPKLDLGVAGGWIIEKIGSYRGSAVNFDIGAVYHLDSTVDLAASAINLGPKFNLEQAGETGSDDISLPTAYRFGGSYRYQRFLGAAEFVYLDDEIHGHLGAEAKLNDYFAIRSGYMINYDSKNFTAGASFRQRNITVDYAFIPFSQNLGTSHLFNLTFSL